MIISKTPLRISFFGGGTDYPAWYLRQGGAVLSTAIDKYCYVMCRHYPPFFDVRHRIIWSRIENVHSTAEIENPVVRGALQMLGFDDSKGVEIHYHGDLPARSGMGSSSAFAAGLIKALYALRGRIISAKELAAATIRLEQEVLAEAVGSQDQVAVATGGFNHVRFCRTGEIFVEPVLLEPARLRALQDHLMLFYTGASRFASQVAATVIDNIQRGSKDDHLRRMHAMVGEALAVLQSDGDIGDFGRMLHETWRLKRELSAKVTTGAVDDLYAAAVAAGALGGKLLGAGESGFMLFFAPPHLQTRVRAALGGTLHVPFRFAGEGATIIHYSDEPRPAEAGLLETAG